MSRTFSRRTFLTGVGAASTTPFLPKLGFARSRSLAQAAQKAGLMFGASVADVVFKDQAYADLYREQTKLLTTDVALKFDYIRWQEGKWDFAEADRLLAFADSYSARLRGHTLIWNENAPAWLKRRPGREVEAIFDEHIEKVVGRYQGRLHSWDVVNEPFWPGHGKKGGYRTGPWYEAMGASYIKRAFKRAASIDPATRLVLNEAHCERDDDVGRKIRKGMLRLVDELLDAGIALDAIGLQGHLQPAKPYSDKAFVDFLWKLHEKGLNIYITELDLDDVAYKFRKKTRDKLIARRYYQFLTEVLKVPSIKGVICWQLADHYSWYRGLALEENPRTKRFPRPLPFDEKYQPKPVYHSMMQAFKERKI